MTVSEKQILKTAESLFNRYGIRSITMDEVCREMRISKKTLYEHVDNKQALVRTLLESIFDREEKAFARIEGKDVCAIDKLYLILKLISRKLKDKHPAFHFDIEKYYPGLFEELDRQRSRRVMQVVKNIIASGIEERLFREDISEEMESFLFFCQIRGCFMKSRRDSDPYSVPEIISAIFRTLIRSLANEKGLAYFERHFRSSDIHMNKE